MWRRREEAGRHRAGADRQRPAGRALPARLRRRIHLADGGGARRDRIRRSCLGADDLHEFYGPFVETLARAEQTMERVRLKDEPAGEDCELCGRPMVIKLGKFGKFQACSGFPDCRNARPLLTRVGRALSDLRRRGDCRAPVEEGSHLLWLRAVPGLRLRLLEQACRSRLPALRQCISGGVGPAGSG